MSELPEHILMSPQKDQMECAHCHVLEGPMLEKSHREEFINEHRDCPAPEEVISAADIPGLTHGMKHYLQAGNQYRVGSESGREKTEPEDQPMPSKNSQPYIHDLVVADILARGELGARRYGARLQPFNGRDVLKDTYEELLDAACYIRQRIYERDAEAEKFVGPVDSEDFGMRFFNHLQAAREARGDALARNWLGIAPRVREAYVEAAKNLLEEIQEGMGKGPEDA